MSWDIEVHEKVYQRLANEIFFRILRGEYALGAKLPSYIDFAKEAGSSPETVARKLSEKQSGNCNSREWLKRRGGDIS